MLCTSCRAMLWTLQAFHRLLHKNLLDLGCAWSFTTLDSLVPSVNSTDVEYLKSFSNFVLSNVADITCTRTSWEIGNTDKLTTDTGGLNMAPLAATGNYQMEEKIKETYEGSEYEVIIF